MKPFWIFIVVLAATLGALGCGSSDDYDAGGSDADTDSDTDTGTDPGNDCSGDGVWYDESSGLCWQDLPPDNNPSPRKWWEAISYCDNLDLGGHTDWRLPNIGELISLIRGCVDGTETGDLSLSICEMTPAGCVETPPCTDKSYCGSCDSGSGPGAGGCYRDPALGGACGYYWSSSPYDSDDAWCVSFWDGFVDPFNVDAWPYFPDVRCVRSSQ